MQYYCQDTYRALLNYAALGLPPGGFAEALLIGDLPLAYKRAHRNLVPFNRGGVSQHDVVNNMFTLVRRLPPSLHGNETVLRTWIGHQGYFGAPKPTKVLVMLFAEPQLISQIEAIIRLQSQSSIC